MDVDEKNAKFKVEYQGKTYHFCAWGCKRAFEATPEKYLRERAEEIPKVEKPWWKSW